MTKISGKFEKEKSGVLMITKSLLVLLKIMLVHIYLSSTLVSG